MTKFKVEYQNVDGTWCAITDEYGEFNTAAMVATALENRGKVTRIIEI